MTVDIAKIDEIKKRKGFTDRTLLWDIANLNTLQLWRNGKQPPDARTASKIADRLGVDISEIAKEYAEYENEMSLDEACEKAWDNLTSEQKKEIFTNLDEPKLSTTS